MGQVGRWASPPMCRLRLKSTGQNGDAIMEPMRRTQRLANEARDLPEDQRLALAKRVLELTEPPITTEVDDARDTELRARIRAYDEGKSRTRPAGEVYRDVDAKLPSCTSSSLRSLGDGPRGRLPRYRRIESLRGDILSVWPGHGTEDNVHLPEIVWILQFAEHAVLEIRLHVKDAHRARDELDVKPVVVEGSDSCNIPVHGEPPSERIDLVGTLASDRELPIRDQLVASEFDPGLHETQLLGRELTCQTAPSAMRNTASAPE